MPFTNAPVATVAPPAVVYHIKELPVAVKLATVGLAPLQKDCAAVPVGADGIAFTVIDTALEAKTCVELFCRHVLSAA